MGLQRASCKSKLYLKRHTPTILTCVGAVGVVLTSVMAVKATPKAIKLLGQAKEDKGESLTKLEIIQVAGPAYIPAVLIGISAISCILGANALNKHNQASLASAYAMLNQSYQRYRKAANTVYGSDADSKIKAQMAKDAYVSAGGYSTYSLDEDSESERILCYDMYSQRYFTATIASVLNAQYHLNRNLSLRGNASVNEFYEFLGINGIDGGNKIGWSLDELMEDGIIWLDFDNRRVEMEDGMMCSIISTPWSDPARLYDKA